MASKVYFTGMRSDFDSNLLERLDKMIARAGLLGIATENDILAVKLHFGEKGSTASLRPAYVRTVVDAMAKMGSRIFLTDTNTLYVGSRSDSVRHLVTASRHGFSYGSMGVPVIIADGLKGTNHEVVEVKGKHFKHVKIAADISRADSLLVLTHVKGHELTGVGGALKNLGMGCASRAGKLAMHSDVRPYVSDKCVGCAKCIEWCPVSAIQMKAERASIDTATCIGCAECIVVCPSKAIKFEWSESAVAVQEKIAEHAAGVLARKRGKAGYVNFLVDIAPQCDCYPFSDASVVPDIGILASLDPVAIDKASVDLINGQPGVPGTALKACEPGADKLRSLYPELDWTAQIRHAEEMGLGSSVYELVKV
ncbi:MAG: DUF362 domain-containing protein [bacterium]